MLLNLLYYGIINDEENRRKIRNFNELAIEKSFVLGLNWIFGFSLISDARARSGRRTKTFSVTRG